MKKGDKNNSLKGKEMNKMKELDKKIKTKGKNNKE
jgi:hypothetical protein